MGDLGKSETLALARSEDVEDTAGAQLTTGIAHRFRVDGREGSYVWGLSWGFGY